MKYYIKFWYPLGKEWRLSTRVDLNGYDDINMAHSMKEFAAKAEANAGYPDMIYIVVDDKETQPPPP